MSANVIVIPIYKEVPNAEEKITLLQCINIFRKHDICILCPEELNLMLYYIVFDELGKDVMEERFPIQYFESIQGYNKLMLNKIFYDRFSRWDYMLIYQLDAYVFRDELDFWASKNYDYIGAPWFNKHGKLQQETVGNGGFSLRKISSFIRLFDDHSEKLLSYKGLRHIYACRGPLRKAFFIISGLLGFCNSINWFMEKYVINEDIYFSALKYKIKHPFISPSVEIAMNFSFEEGPEILYKQNGGKIPFGCHAWEKHLSFWRSHIK